MLTPEIRRDCLHLTLANIICTKLGICVIAGTTVDETPLTRDDFEEIKLWTRRLSFNSQHLLDKIDEYAHKHLAKAEAQRQVEE